MKFDDRTAGAGVVAKGSIVEGATGRRVGRGGAEGGLSSDIDLELGGAGCGGNHGQLVADGLFEIGEGEGEAGAAGGRRAGCDNAASADLTGELQGGVAEVYVRDEDDSEFDDGEEEEDEWACDDGEFDCGCAISAAKSGPQRLQ